MSSRTWKGRAKRGKAKIKSKPTQIDGIKFRSKLEAHCYRMLKDANIDADYEKHKYVLLKGFHYPQSRFEDNGKTGYQDKQKRKVRDITYTPDFVDPKGRWIIECKGYANERFPLKWKMFLDLMMKQKNPPVVFVPRNQGQNKATVEAILNIESGFTVL